MDPTNEEGARPLYHICLEVTAIAVVLTTCGFLVWQLVGAISSPLLGLVVGGMGLLGYIVADFISGLVHWLADRFGTIDTPLLGRNFILPFREHHIDPKGITRHGFVETNGNNCIVSVPFIVPIALYVPIEGFLNIGLVSFGVFFILSIFATNQFHKWAHMDDPPALARFLQRWNLILTKENHDLHHTAPFDTYYCITTGWLNRPLQALRFYEALEWMIARLFGAKAGVHGPFPE